MIFGASWENSHPRIPPVRWTAHHERHRTRHRKQRRHEPHHESAAHAVSAHDVRAEPDVCPLSRTACVNWSTAPLVDRPEHQACVFASAATRPAEPAQQRSRRIGGWSLTGRLIGRLIGLCSVVCSDACSVVCSDACSDDCPVAQLTRSATDGVSGDPHLAPVKGSRKEHKPGHNEDKTRTEPEPAPFQCADPCWRRCRYDFEVRRVAPVQESGGERRYSSARSAMARAGWSFGQAAQMAAKPAPAPAKSPRRKASRASP